MFGMFGTIAVIAQMAVLSLGYSTELVMTVGLFACGAWVIHAIKNSDNWLLATNTVVAGFAAWGLA